MGKMLRTSSRPVGSVRSIGVGDLSEGFSTQILWFAFERIAEERFDHRWFTPNFWCHGQACDVQKGLVAYLPLTLAALFQRMSAVWKYPWNKLSFESRISALEL